MKIISPDGFEYKNEEWQYHRLDGPAVDLSETKEWYINGKLHRIGGPARILNNGSYKSWWNNGVRHNIYGPARIWKERKEWWLYGCILTENQFEEFKDSLFSLER